MLEVLVGLEGRLWERDWLERGLCEVLGRGDAVMGDHQCQLLPGEKLPAQWSTALILSMNSTWQSLSPNPSHSFRFQENPCVLCPKSIECDPTMYLWVVSM